jgi:integrating conjugative element protein (TIGR03761 family)
MAEDLRLNLGALRSAMQLTLHTHHASRIWNGRTPSEGRPGIIGLNGFVTLASRMHRGAEQDDPYSDWWILRIEEKLTDTKSRLQALREQVDQALAAVPAELSLGENLNVQPVKLPLFVSSQLGFLAVYLLADYDNLARRVILAHHTALIDRHTMERWLTEGAHYLRSTFTLAQQYKYSGAARDDFAANNAVARTARERFGDLPQDVLEGTRRSRYAPPIIRRSGLAASLSTLTTAAAEDSSDAPPAVDVPVDEDDERGSRNETADPPA